MIASRLSTVCSLPVRALSVRQPWAYAILHMGKDVENRTWEPPANLLGVRFWIHASKKVEALEPWELLGQRFTLADDGLCALAHLPRGAIVGSARLADVVEQSASRWFAGPIGWVLTEPIPLETPIPCQGRLGLWHVPDPILEQLREQGGRP